MLDPPSRGEVYLPPPTPVVSKLRSLTTFPAEPCKNPVPQGGGPSEGHFGTHLGNLRLGFDDFGLGFEILGPGSAVLGLGFEVLALQPRSPAFRYRVPAVGSGVTGGAALCRPKRPPPLGFEVLGLGWSVQRQGCGNLGDIILMSPWVLSVFVPKRLQGARRWQW